MNVWGLLVCYTVKNLLSNKPISIFTRLNSRPDQLIYNTIILHEVPQYVLMQEL